MCLTLFWLYKHQENFLLDLITEWSWFLKLNCSPDSIAVRVNLDLLLLSVLQSLDT